MGRGRPKGSKTVFKIKDLRTTLENENFNPVEEALKIYKATKNEWMKFKIITEFMKYLFPTAQITSDVPLKDLPMPSITTRVTND